MADTLCGPSNPLQNFQKHTSVDRTLQQDRLSSRPGPSQGFRSGLGPNAGILDPEFEAFQAGLPTASPIPTLQPFQAQSRGGPAFGGGANITGWAADFQRLQVSSPSPSIAQQPSLFRTSTPQAHGSWHQDFLRQQGQKSTELNSAHAPHLPLTGAGFAHHGIHQPYGFHAGPSEMPQSTLAQGNVGQEAMGGFDDAAFEEAFEAAHADLHYRAETAQRKATALPLDHFEYSRDLVDALEEAGIRDTMVDHIQESERGTQRQPENENVDDNDLAQAAGQLLASVSDDMSQKFQESNFLALMRRLRDHEVHVEGDKMVEVSATPSPSYRAPSTETDEREEGSQHLHTPPVSELITCKTNASSPAPGPAADMRIPTEQQDTDLGRGDVTAIPLTG